MTAALGHCGGLGLNLLKLVVQVQRNDQETANVGVKYRALQNVGVQINMKDNL